MPLAAPLADVAIYQPNSLLVPIGCTIPVGLPTASGSETIFQQAARATMSVEHKSGFAMILATSRLMTRIARFLRAEEGVSTIEWVALAGVASIGAIAVFWWAQAGGLNPTTNTIQSQIDAAAHSSVLTYP